MRGEFRESMPMSEVESAEKDPTFEEGLEMAFNRIKELLEKQDYVVVAINGSGTDVGKTKFTAELSKKLKDIENYIPTIDMSNIGSLKDGIVFLKEQQEGFEKLKGVLILNAYEIDSLPNEAVEEIKESESESIRESSGKLGLSVEKIDIWIDIYSPEKPFEKDDMNTDQMGDIIIRNEGAVEK